MYRVIIENDEQPSAIATMYERIDGDWVDIASVELADYSGDYGAFLHAMVEEMMHENGCEPDGCVIAVRGSDGKLRRHAASLC